MRLDRAAAQHEGYHCDPDRILFVGDGQRHGRRKSTVDVGKRRINLCGEGDAVRRASGIASASPAIASSYFRPGKTGGLL